MCVKTEKVIFMKEKLLELYELLKLDRKRSSWSRKNSLEERCDELSKEVEEIKEALEKNDDENFKEEVGDVIWDLFSLIIIAEEEELLTMKEVVQNTIEKIKRRKPWLFTDEVLTADEERKRWEEIKAAEKCD